ncbi:MAG: hypothetical protein GC184_09345 [Rhizobiales bacterium]|nr:hypothetical protein [Hyphomicrobiales bacterium]
MRPAHPYAGRRAVLATMHGKEAAIRAPFRDGLGLDVTTPDHIDTDVFGTFTGEIRREKGIKETAVAKARLGMALTGLSIGIASEGSFGPHPEIPIIAADMELMVLIDDERGVVLSEALISEETNFAHIEIEPDSEMDAFLARVKFPDHGLIVAPNMPTHSEWSFIKGIVEKAQLMEAVKAAARHSSDGMAFVQTDMRAHLNPSRMCVLEKLAEQLVDRLKMLCPSCDAPGFGRLDVQRGLPCGYCGTPTRWVKAEIFGCESCGLRETRDRSDGVQVAKQENCPACNP